MKRGGCRRLGAAELETSCGLDHACQRKILLSLVNLRNITLGGRYVRPIMRGKKKMHFDVESMLLHINVLIRYHAYIVVLLAGSRVRSVDECTFISRKENRVSQTKRYVHDKLILTKMIPSNLCLNQDIVSSLVTRCWKPTRALRSFLLATRIPGLPITT